MRLRELSATWVNNFINSVTIAYKYIGRFNRNLSSSKSISISNQVTRTEDDDYTDRRRREDETTLAAGDPISLIRSWRMKIRNRVIRRERTAPMPLNHANESFGRRDEVEYLIFFHNETPLTEYPAFQFRKNDSKINSSFFLLLSNEYRNCEWISPN